MNALYPELGPTGCRPRHGARFRVSVLGRVANPTEVSPRLLLFVYEPAMICNFNRLH